MGNIFTEHVFPRYVGRQVMKPQMNGFDDPTLRDFSLLDSSVLMKEDLKSELFGSSDIRWGSWGESAGGEEHAEPVVVAVAEAAGEAAVQLDDPVHGLSAAVR